MIILGVLLRKHQAFQASLHGMYRAPFPLLSSAYGLSILAASILWQLGAGPWTVLLIFWLGGGALVFALPLSSRMSARPHSGAQHLPLRKGR